MMNKQLKQDVREQLDAAMQLLPEGKDQSNLGEELTEWDDLSTDFEVMRAAVYFSGYLTHISYNNEDLFGPLSNITQNLLDLATVPYGQLIDTRE